MELDLGHDRRQENRKSVDLGFEVRVRVYAEDQRNDVKAYCRNLSFNGMGLVVPQKISSGEKVHVAVSLGEEDLGVLFYGRCVWCKTEGNQFLAGIHFIPDQDVLGKMKLLFSKLDQYILPRFL